MLGSRNFYLLVVAVLRKIKWIPFFSPSYNAFLFFRNLWRYLRRGVSWYLHFIIISQALVLVSLCCKVMSCCIFEVVSVGDEQVDMSLNGMLFSFLHRLKANNDDFRDGMLMNIPDI